MAKRGRPLKFKTVEELEQRINDYFDNCPDYVILTSFDKQTGEFVEYKKFTPTMCGLALYLGFTNRASMYDYEERSKFSNTIKNARGRIENMYEKQLYCPQCTGAIFALKNLGWKDKVENEITASESTQEAFLKHLKAMGNNAD